MNETKDLSPISPKTLDVIPTAEHIVSGIPIPKSIRITTFSPEEWESFTEEWASSLESDYVSVRRFTGAGDQGVDIAGFLSDEGFNGTWDNFQCKRYGKPLTPSDIWVEIGKILYYSFTKQYSVPRKYYFIAPKGIGTTLHQLLSKKEELKSELIKNWDGYCKEKITSTKDITLDAEFLVWVESFDFSIFSSKSAIDLITDHSKTQFHSIRFGGGLPARPIVTCPPVDHMPEESRYIQQIFDAYSNHLGVNISDVSELSSCKKPNLKDDFLRQRERFYHAESLRNFARDNVPEGTFESLQEEVFHAVIDVCQEDYEDGLKRMRATLSHAGTIATTTNPLTSVVRVQDHQGICHQLSNVNRLKWISDAEVTDDSSL